VIDCRAFCTSTVEVTPVSVTDSARPPMVMMALTGAVKPEVSITCSNFCGAKPDNVNVTV
jgi:hypothetical protein